tara:strand:- start:22247 stop:22753 length:507 start_codon:yes stop_codon:yes gene_type:complete
MNNELYYLVNPIYSKIINDKMGVGVSQEEQCSKEEKRFYKKRILQMTKDCMHGKTSNKVIEAAFLEYLRTCVEYFKEEDKVELMQMEYGELSVDENKKVDDIDIEKINEDLFKKDDVKRIESCFPVEKRKIKKEEEVVYPKKKDVNIKEGRFKTKGVKKGKKKNMDNI